MARTNKAFNILGIIQRYNYNLVTVISINSEI